MTELFQINKAGSREPVFVGPQEVVERCLRALNQSFSFVAGTDRPKNEESPYSISPN